MGSICLLSRCQAGIVYIVNFSIQFKIILRTRRKFFVCPKKETVERHQRASDHLVDHQLKLPAVVSLEELTFRAFAHFCSDSGLNGTGTCLFLHWDNEIWLTGTGNHTRKIGTGDPL